MHLTLADRPSFIRHHFRSAAKANARVRTETPGVSFFTHAFARVYPLSRVGKKSERQVRKEEAVVAHGRPRRRTREDAVERGGCVNVGIRAIARGLPSASIGGTMPHPAINKTRPRLLRSSRERHRVSRGDAPFRGRNFRNSYDTRMLLADFHPAATGWRRTIYKTAPGRTGPSDR